MKPYQRLWGHNAVLSGEYVSDEPATFVFRTYKRQVPSETFIYIFLATRIRIYHRENLKILYSSSVNCWSALFWLHAHNFHFWSLKPTSSTRPLKQRRNKRALGCITTWFGCHSFRFPECTALYIFEENLADFLVTHSFTVGTKRCWFRWTDSLSWQY